MKPALAFLLLSLCPQQPALARGPDGNFFVGYNQAWFRDAYGEDLSSKFDAENVRKTFTGILEAGGSVARIMLFTVRQGIEYQDSVSTGLSPKLLENLGTVLKIAGEEKVKVYVTPLTATEAVDVKDEWRRFYERLFHEEKAAEAFDRKVLGPVLDLLGRHRDAVYAMDIVNEIDALLSKLFASEAQVRHWVRRRAAFVKSRSPWLKTTVSVGWGGAQYLLANGLMSGLGLDFYDLHMYSDSGTYRGATAVCERAKADGVPIILGEFGQKTQKVDDAMQSKATFQFLDTAYNLCFSGALAWVYQAGHTPWWSFVRPDGTLRPAAQVIQEFPRTLAQKQQSTGKKDPSVKTVVRAPASSSARRR